MRVYIAAPYPWREAAIGVMAQLEAAGIEVTSTWLKQEHAQSDARTDLADVDRADVLVAINPPEYKYSGTGGRHVEFGYALAREKRLVLVGEPANVFHHIKEVISLASCAEIIDALRRLQSLAAIEDNVNPLLVRRRHLGDRL